MRVLTYVEDNKKNQLVKVASLWFQRYFIKKTWSHDINPIFQKNGKF